jgi:hypothetical protein
MTMRQFLYQGIRFLGTPPNCDEDYVNWCPDCGRRLVDAHQGYGLAHGGGLGTYIWCSNLRCEWFYKMLDGI